MENIIANMKTYAGMRYELCLLGQAGLHFCACLLRAFGGMLQRSRKSGVGGEIGKKEKKKAKKKKKTKKKEKRQTKKKKKRKKKTHTAVHTTEKLHSTHNKLQGGKT